MVAFNHRKLREWRLASGLRPEEVCARAGVSYSYLRGIEDGARVNPSARMLARIAAVYGRSLDELFTTDDAEPAGAR
jgi:transcriptional regulator with XRE-family HTH domain